MALTYTWKVTELFHTTEGVNNQSVVNVRWEKIGTDENGNVGIFAGATPFSSVNTENFIPFDQLTEEIVLGWVKDHIEEHDSEDHINEQLQRELDERIELIANVEDDALPWT